MKVHVYLCRMSGHQESDSASDSEDQERDFYVPSYSDTLFSATIAGDTSELQRLIEIGGDVNKCDGAWTVTHAASYFNKHECLQVLIRAGGNVNAVCSSAFPGTPLIHALTQKNVECAKILIENGADVNAESCHHESVFFLCMQIPTFVNIEFVKDTNACKS